MSGNLFVSVFVPLLMSVGGYKRKSLDFSGALTAFIVGFTTFFGSTRCGIVLITFFVTSSAVTKVGKERKRKIEGEEFKEGFFLFSPKQVFIIH